MPTKEDMLYAMVKETRDDVKAINKKLTGNGAPGMITRLDRVEQSLARQSKFWWICFSTAICTLGAYLFNFFK